MRTNVEPQSGARVSRRTRSENGPANLAGSDGRNGHTWNSIHAGPLCAWVSQAYNPIRDKPIVQTSGEDLLTVIHANGNCVAHYLRRLHNLALDLGWLPWPIFAKRAWPKIRSRSKRAITAEEHQAVIASEKNPERRTYYEFLYESGAAKTDAANLTAEDIDWQNGVLVYRCKKLGSFSDRVDSRSERNFGVCSRFFRHRAICFPTSKELLRIIDQRNFGADATLLELEALVYTAIGVPGRSEQRLAAIRSVLLKRRSATVVALFTKPTQKAPS